MITYLLTFFLLLSPPVESEQDDDTVIYYTNKGTAEFTSRVPLHSFTGSSDYLTGMIDFERNSIDFYLDLSTLRSGIDRRDNDMFRTLNVEEHPFAEFTGGLEEDFDTDSDERQRVTAYGTFVMNGVVREMRVRGYIQKQGDGYLVEADWILNMEDFDLEPPGILFYRVNEEQEMSVKAFLEPRKRSDIIPPSN